MPTTFLSLLPALLRGLSKPSDRAGRGAQARGQILVVFALGIVALLLMAGLVFDGAQALTLRRQLQNASDAGALAAANLIQSGSPKGCSASAGSPPGAPRADVTAAAIAMVQTNIPGFPAARVAVSCPVGWSNFAVQVQLQDRAAGYFAGVAGINGLPVAVESQALNGQVMSVKYSIVELNPGSPTFPSSRNGCPSVLFSGGPTVTMDGSMIVNSNCAAADGGPLGTNGNAATVQMASGSLISLVGTYKPGTLTITPAPLSGQKKVKDPLLGLTDIPVASLVVRRTNKYSIGSDTLLEPGVYVGGIEVKNSAKVFLRPGIYVMQGGGFALGAQSGAYSIAAGKISTTDATWATDCPKATCGVLLFNTGISGKFDQISVAAGSTLKMRPYRASIDTSGFGNPEYDNILLWQNALPVPTNAFAQPSVYLNGGGTVDISGTVYAPSALVEMGGGSGGAGGSATDLTLQFISWDLTLSGNSGFHFFYKDEFARPTDYGLIK